MSPSSVLSLARDKWAAGECHNMAADLRFPSAWCKLPAEENMVLCFFCLPTDLHFNFQTKETILTMTSDLLGKKDLENDQEN